MRGEPSPVSFTRANLYDIKIYVKDIYQSKKVAMLAAAAARRYVADMISPAQIRAARAILGWTQVELARASGVSEISIKNIERGATDPRSSTLNAIQSAFLTAGVVFLEAGDARNGGPGIRMLK
jgi:DNA-binding XRE family transcriptional regulator